MSDNEKNDGALDNTSSNQDMDQFRDPDAGLSDHERAKIDRKLVWKLDLQLMPWLCLLYLICYLDRINIGNAKIAKMEPALGINDGQYSAALSIFFVSYAIFEALANFLLKRLRPSIFIPTIMVLWGCCMLGMGFVTNFSGLMAARWFLGVAEAGLFPGINYYLSCWYKRSEFGVRAAIFFSAAAFAGSFGGLLAAAIQTLDGKHGLDGWQWIFIIEGAATIFVALLSYVMVHDFPDEARFLSKDDRARVLLRLKKDKQASSAHEDFKMDYAWQAIKDWKTYCGMLIYMGPLMPLYAYSLFLPTIITNMSFTDADQVIKNQLLSVPPYALAAIMTVVVGFMSDRLQKRGIFNLIFAPICIIGFIMMMASDKAPVQYAGTFLGAAGIFPCVSLTIAWVANNVEGVYKRGIVLGIVIGWGNINGVVSSNVYGGKPRFFAGHATVIGYMFFGSFLGSILYYILLNKENKQRLAGKRDQVLEGKTPEEVRDLGDKRPDFIYTL